MKYRAKLSEKGDTIVEVLVSIAVVSLVLAGAFVATNRSLTATRDSQERSDALKLVESQLELLKAEVVDPTSIIFTSAPSSYCMASGTAIVSTNAWCKMNAAGTATTTDPQYNIAITRSGNNFTITNSWIGASGNPAQLQMKYRLYE